MICVPNWNEPFGLTTFEGYAAGCRVIGSAEGVVGRLVDQVDPGWTVAPGDPAALAACMQAAIDGGTALPASGQAIFSEILARQRPEMVARKYLSLYEKALGAKNA